MTNALRAAKSYFKSQNLKDKISLSEVQIDPLGDLKKTIRIKSALNLRRSKAGIKKKPDK